MNSAGFGVLVCLLVGVTGGCAPSVLEQPETTGVEVVATDQSDLVAGYDECRLIEPIVGCVITVRAIDHLSVRATSENRHPVAEATYNPPPGFAILETSTVVWRSKRGSHSVSTFAAGATFALSEDLEAAYASALNAYASLAAKAKAQGVDGERLKGIKLSLDQKYNSAVHTVLTYSSSHNTIYAKVWADKVFWGRAWEDISVDAKLIYVGTPATIKVEFDRVLQPLRELVNDT
jgi:hypothetical protein